MGKTMKILLGIGFGFVGFIIFAGVLGYYLNQGKVQPEPVSQMTDSDVLSELKLPADTSQLGINEAHYALYDTCMKSTLIGDITNCALDFYAIKHYCSNPELYFEACDDPRIDEFLDSKTFTALGKTMTARDYVSELVRNLQNTLSGCLKPEAINPHYELFSSELQTLCDITINELDTLCNEHEIQLCEDERLLEYKRIRNLT